MIYMYIDELKRLGLYEDATIVITGDHPDPLKDYEDVPKPRLTALFVKPSGSSGTPLAHSEDAVSQSLLIPSLVQSAGLVTERDYGPTYWDGSQALRRYLFIKNVEPDRYRIVEYSVTGDGRSFDNWRKLGEKDVGFLYK